MTGRRISTKQAEDMPDARVLIDIPAYMKAYLHDLKDRTGVTLREATAAALGRYLADEFVALSQKTTEPVQGRLDYLRERGYEPTRPSSSYVGMTDVEAADLELTIRESAHYSAYDRLAIRRLHYGEGFYVEWHQAGNSDADVFHSQEEYANWLEQSWEEVKA